MGSVIEPAASGRARCRGCNRTIAKGELRMGERLPNPYADGEMTLWFHLRCGACKRPDALLSAFDANTLPVEDRDELTAWANAGIAHRRLPRLDGAQRAPTGRARCRSCRELISRGDWRIRLVFYEEGRFEPSGFIHVRCADTYFETIDIIDRLRHFSPELVDDDIAAIDSEMTGQGE